MERYCTKCRSRLPEGAGRCGNCGEIAGEVFDGKIRKPDRKRGSGFFFALLVLLAAGGAYYWWTLQQAKPGHAGPIVLPSARVVGDRPGGARRGEGAKITEAEAIRLLQRHLVAGGSKLECLVVSSQGFRAGAYRLSVLERCGHVRLGRWNVDGATGTIARGE